MPPTDRGQHMAATDSTLEQIACSGRGCSATLYVENTGAPHTLRCDKCHGTVWISATGARYYSPPAFAYFVRARPPYV